MKRSLLALLLFASPASAGPLYLGPWSLVPDPDPRFALAYMPDVVRSVPATSSSGGGGGSTLPVVDTTNIVKGSADATKLLRFEVDGFTSGQTRVITPPDSNTTLPIASQVITFAGPTAARTVTLPDAAFTVAGQNFANTFDQTNIASGRWVFGTAADAANSIDANANANCLTGEGTAADGFENQLCWGNGGLDVVTSLPWVTSTQTIAVLEGAQTFTGSKTFNVGPTVAAAAENTLTIGSAAFLSIYQDTTQTPDTPLMGTGTNSNALNIAEVADEDFDFNNGPCGTAACTHPTVNIHSATQNTTEYNGLAYFGRAGNAIKTLTESNATAVVAIPVASGAAAGGILEYGIFASDATDHQLRQSSIRYSIVNKAGTETCTLTAMDGATANAETNDDNAAAISSGTLTYAIACDCTGTNTCSITFNAVSSLTQSTLQARWSISHVGPGLPGPQ